jgi:hypothetical protein
MKPARKSCLAIGGAIMASAAVIEAAMGRKLWGVGGKPGVWSGNIVSAHNSQFMFDPYTLTHVTHGILFYGLFWLAAPRLPARVRALMALALEAIWEVLENSAMVIERYRAQTISLHYYGDSIVNSMCDIGAMMLGFLIASLIPARLSVLLVIAMEIGLALWIRDGLLLNIVMLTYPVQAIRVWQMHRV